jgi:hypothetical protein
VVGGSAARVTAGLQELAEVEGDPDAGDAVVLDVQPVGDGEGSPSPRGVAVSLDEFRLPLADDAEAAEGEAGVISRP